jgi:hypothetical protein
MRFSAALRRRPTPPLPKGAVPLPRGASRANKRTLPAPAPAQAEAPRELPPDLDQQVRLVGEW